MYQVWIAYLLWLFGGFGVLGLHRFYMRKIPTGVLWIVTGGLGFLGAAYDFFTMTRQIATANARDGRHQLGWRPDLPPVRSQEQGQQQRAGRTGA